MVNITEKIKEYVRRDDTFDQNYDADTFVNFIGLKMRCVGRRVSIYLHSNSLN